MDLGGSWGVWLGFARFLQDSAGLGISNGLSSSQRFLEGLCWSCRIPAGLGRFSQVLMGFVRFLQVSVGLGISKGLSGSLSRSRRVSVGLAGFWRVSAGLSISKGHSSGLCWWVLVVLDGIGWALVGLGSSKGLSSSQLVLAYLGGSRWVLAGLGKS